MNENLVKALAAAGKEVQEKDKADKAKAEEQKKTGGATRARKCNAHLRPDNWKGEEVDE
jgi:hypothetical protein